MGLFFSMGELVILQMPCLVKCFLALATFVLSIAVGRHKDSLFSVHFPFHSCKDENQTNNGGDDKARLGESKLTMITVNMLMMMLAMIQGDFFHWYSP